MELVYLIRRGVSSCSGAKSGGRGSCTSLGNREPANMSECSIYSVMQREIHAPCQLHELVNRESTGAHELFVERGGTFRRQSLDERESV